MTAQAKAVAESALSLAADERAELAERLLLSLDEKYQMASIREALHAARTGDLTGIAVHHVDSNGRRDGKFRPVTPRKNRATLPS